MTDETQTARPDKALAAPAAQPEAFDDILGNLRKLVDRLESGNLSLEESLRCFEQGMQFCRQGATILDGAERRVEVLLARPGNTIATAPLDPEGEEAQGEEAEGSE